MRFEWDENKNETNQKKHGISFETAKLIFNDPSCLFVLDRKEAGEQRWHAIGMIPKTAAVLTVVHTEIREGSIRIISARRATKQEQNDYAQSL